MCNISGSHFSSPNKPPPLAGIPKISLLYSLMSASARKIDAAESERCCRYLGATGGVCGSARVAPESAYRRWFMQMNRASFIAWKRCIGNNFSFSFTTRAHRHTLCSQSTQSHNSCFVSGIMFCRNVVTLLRVSQTLLCFLSVCVTSSTEALPKVGNSSKKNNPNQMLQIQQSIGLAGCTH